MGSLEHCHWPRRDFVHIPVWNINWAFPDDPAHRLGAPVAGIESCDCRSSDREPGEMELASAGKARGQGQCAGPRLAGMLFHGFLWDLCLFGIGDCVGRLSCGCVGPRSPARESGTSLTTTFGENLNNLRLF